MVAEQLTGLTPQEEQSMESTLAAANAAKMHQVNAQVSDGLDAYFAQNDVGAAAEEAQAAIAAGGSSSAPDAPLTDNKEPPDPQVHLQNINVHLSSAAPSLAEIGQQIETGLQQGSLPGVPDQWTTHFNPNVGQQVAHSLTTGDELVWDPTNEEWDPAPEIPEVVVSATREPTAAQYAANQEELANQTNYLIGQVASTFGPGGLAKATYNAAIGLGGDLAYFSVRAVGGTTQLANNAAAMVDRAQVSPNPLEQAMERSVSPYLQSAYQGLAGVVGNDTADDLSHLAGLGLNSLAVLPVAEPLSTVGSSLRESIGQVGDLFSGGSASTGGAPLTAQLGRLDLSLVPDSTDTIGATAPEQEVIAQRKATARSFYEQTGWSSDRIDSHLQGIDFSRPVDVVTLPQGADVVQYQIPGNPVGRYFSPIGTPAETIGVDPTGRLANVFTTGQDVTVLRSFAADTTANMALPALARGPKGGVQYFTNDPLLFQPK